MAGFVDIHAHFIYGMDDGADSEREMETMLDIAYDDGITSLYATPHMVPGMYRFDHVLFNERLEKAQAYCDSRNYSIKLHVGAEIMYTPLLDAFVERNKLPTLGETTCILVEFLPDISIKELDHAAALIMRNGYTMILAHMERYDCLYHPGIVKRLKDKYNIKYQINCNTVIRGCGLRRNGYIQSWLKQHLIDYIATDAHDTQKRTFTMRQAYDKICLRYGEDFAIRLTMRQEILG